MTHTDTPTHAPAARPRRRRKVALGAVVLAAAAFAAGCGSDEPQADPAVEWADGVCSSLVTWKDSISSIGESLTGGGISQSALSDAADDAEAATNTLLDDLRDLGRPETDAGDEAQDAVESLADEIEQAKQEIEDAVDGVEGLGDVLGAVSTVSTSLATISDEISSTYDTLQELDPEGELRDAFEQASSCDELTGS